MYFVDIEALVYQVALLSAGSVVSPRYCMYKTGFLKNPSLTISLSQHLTHLLFNLAKIYFLPKAGSFTLVARFSEDKKLQNLCAHYLDHPWCSFNSLNMKNGKVKCTTEPKYLLCILSFLKSYWSEKVNSLVQICDVKTFRK